MKTAKISGMKYPIVLVESTDHVERSSDAVQCVRVGSECIQAYFFDRGRWFSATAKTSVAASAKIALDVDQFIRDCATVCVVDGVSFPVRHRSVLYVYASDKDACAPPGVIHWWNKGLDDAPHYKCDIHHLCDDGEILSLEGMGPDLEDALRYVTELSIAYGFGSAAPVDEQQAGND